MEQELVRRAVSDPKPLYYREDSSTTSWSSTCSARACPRPTRSCPTSSCAGSFRRSSHIAARITKRWRERYGYTVDVADLAGINDETDFLELVATAIDRKGRGG